MVHHRDTKLVPELNETSGTDKKTCDEYTFNATYQSAVMKAADGGLNPNPVSDTNRGKECVQTYAPQLPDGTWKLYDDERYPAPIWEETCGRSSMSGNVNSGSMNRFGAFARELRILDKDYY